MNVNETYKWHVMNTCGKEPLAAAVLTLTSVIIGLVSDERDKDKKIEEKPKEA